MGNDRPVRVCHDRYYDSFCVVVVAAAAAAAACCTVCWSSRKKEPSLSSSLVLLLLLVSPETDSPHFFHRSFPFVFVHRLDYLLSPIN